MKSIAVRNIERADANIVKVLGEYGVATVHEAQARTGLMQPYMRPIYSGCRVAGSIVTVLAQPGDNWMLHVAAELCQQGDMLVVAVTTENSSGMFGELLATSFMAKGAVGLIIDAGCRDVAELQDLGFPVWSRAINAQGTVKATPGAVNIPIVCAGTAVNPGDIAIADDDGVCIVPRAKAAAVAEASQARLDKEAVTRKRLQSGELGLDIYGMRPKLEAAGLVYIDNLQDPEQP